MTDHRISARIDWRRGAARFVDQDYSRVHRWTFDGGATVTASASPLNVPKRYADRSAVDPEEALLAAVSSCHMLWFLSLAAGRGFVVDSYEDEAEAALGSNENGRQAITRVTLRPLIRFAGTRPSADALGELHEAAHRRCFVANSLICEVEICHDRAGAVRSR